VSFVPPKAVFLPLHRIERITEEHLIASGLMPSLDSPVVDIEAFLDNYLKVHLDQHADLPPDELGVTHFCPGKVPQVKINRDLTNLADDEDSPFWAEGRWRSTLGHEAAHVIFHRADYEIERQASLFGDESNLDEGPRLHRCLKRDFGVPGKVTASREYQANAGMAALLMPRRLFEPLSQPLLWRVSPHFGDPGLEATVRSLAERFRVSCGAARIRIKTLGLRSLCGQGTLIP